MNDLGHVLLFRLTSFVWFSINVMKGNHNAYSTLILDNAPEPQAGQDKTLLNLQNSLKFL